MKFQFKRVLHFMSLFFTVYGRSLEKILRFEESYLQKIQVSQVIVRHIIEKRDDKPARAVERLDDLKLNAGENY